MTALSGELRRELREELSDGSLSTQELAAYLLSDECREGETASLARDAQHAVGVQLLALAAVQAAGQSPVPVDGNTVAAALLVVNQRAVHEAEALCRTLVENGVIASYGDGYAASLVQQLTSLYIQQNSGGRPGQQPDRQSAPNIS